MHPYLPFAAIPIAVTAAWFSAAHWSGGEPGRYRVPPVAQIESPSVPADERAESAAQPDIRVAAFLPHVPPRPPSPAPALILHSVMIGSDVHLATINGQVVKQGESIAGYLVQRITADGVELVNGGETRRLPMRPLHELPPPTQPGTDPAQRNVAVHQNGDDLTHNFWATFNSPQPEL
jgi:hypothetical protein